VGLNTLPDDGKRLRIFNVGAYSMATTEMSTLRWHLAESCAAAEPLKRHDT
jgi:hypothetical protein